jgi:hypothetical protein
MLSRIFLGALVFASVCSSSVSANVVVAGDFENVAAVSDSWYLTSAIVDTDSSAAHSGSNSIRSVVSSDAPVGTLARIQQYLTVPTVCHDGSTPALKFWYRTEGSGVSGVVHVYQGFEDSHKRVEASVEVRSALHPSAAYTLASADLSVFAGYKVGINVEFLGADASASFYADDFSIC